MASGAVKLMLALDGEDKLSAVIQKADRQMRNFSKSAKTTGKGATRNFATLRGTISNVGTSFTELNSKVMLLRSAFAAVKAAGEFAISGEIANNAERVFSQISGGAGVASERMAKMREVSRGMVDDTSLQQFATRLAMAGADFGQTMEALAIGTEVGLSTQTDVKDAINGMAKAAISGRATAFKMLGVTADLNKELDKEAKKTGRVREEMSASEQISIRLALAQEAVGGALRKNGVDTSALSTKLRELKTDMENIESAGQQAVAGLFSPEALKPKAAAISKLIAATLKNAGNDLKDLGAAADPYEVRLTAFSEKFAALTGASVDAIKTQVLETIRHGDSLNKDLAESSERSAVLGMAFATLQQEHARKQISKTRDAALEADRLKESERMTLARNIAEIEAGIFAMEEDYHAEALGMTKAEQRERRLAIDQEKVALLLEQKKITLRQASLQLLKLENKAAEAAAPEKKEKRDKARAAYKKRRADAAKNEKAIEDLKSDALLAGLNRRDLLSDDYLVGETAKAEKLAAIEKRTREELAKADARSAERVRREKKATLKEVGDLDLDFAAHGKRIQAENEATDRKASEDLEKEKTSIRKEGADARQLAEETESENYQAQLERRTQLLEEAADREREIMRETIATWSDLSVAIARPLDPLSQLIERSGQANEGLKILGATTAATAAATQTYSQEADEAKSAQENLQKNTPAMISAGGTAAAAFVKQTKTKALIQGAFETASSIAAYATGNIIGGTGHAAAAAAFFALAGGSGGGKKSTKYGQSAALTAGGGGGGTGFGIGSGSQNIVVNVQGFSMGSSKDLGTQIGSTIGDVQETGINSTEV